jgi:hypothetical protein
LREKKGPALPARWKTRFRSATLILIASRRIALALLIALLIVAALLVGAIALLVLLAALTGAVAIALLLLVRSRGVAARLIARILVAFAALVLPLLVLSWLILIGHELLLLVNSTQAFSSLSECVPVCKRPPFPSDDSYSRGGQL